MAAASSAVALAALIACTGAANAGEIPASASVTVDCDGGVGVITVTIADQDDFHYRITIGSDLHQVVAEDATVDGQGDFAYSGYANGDYPVGVLLKEFEQNLLSEVVTVDCAPVETTTTTSTVPVDTARPAGQEGARAEELPATGGGPTALYIGMTLSALGSLMVIVARRRALPR